MLSAHRKRKDHLLGLVRELRGLPGESEWVEFKSNLADPRRIGEYVSALANGAALEDRAHGYLLWGVENESHAVVGTNFAPQRTKAPQAGSNEPLETWLARLLEPGVHVAFHELPAPLFETPPGFTRAVLYGRKPLGEMDRAERVRACYQHACLKRITGGFLTNASLRQRFGIKENNRAVISRHIREATSAGLIVPFDANAGRRMMKYLPYWARDGSAASIDSSAVPDPAN